MRLVPPTRDQPFRVTIYAEGPWALNQESPYIPDAEWSMEQTFSPDDFRRRVHFTISQHIRSNSPEDAIALAITKTNHMSALYPGWLNDAAAYSVSVEYQKEQDAIV